MGPLLDMAVQINPQIIVSALVGTSVVFGCFSVAALTAERGRWLYLGGTLMTLLSTMLMLSLANLLFGSRLIFQVCRWSLFLATRVPFASIINFGSAWVGYLLELGHSRWPQTVNSW